MASSVPVVETRRTSLTSKTSALRLDIALLIFIFIFAFSVRYVTLQAPGITWDEPSYVHASIAYVDNLLHLRFDSGSYNDNSEQPPVAKYLYGAAIWALNGGVNDYRAFVIVKTLSAVMGSATCVLLFLIGRRFFDRKTAFLSGMILALIPAFVAHTQIAALDSPQAMFFTLTLFLFMMALKTKEWPYFLASAISLGLLIDTKFTGILVLPILAVVFIIDRHASPHEKNASTGARALYYLPPLSIAAFLLISAATALIIYPWIWGGYDNIHETLSHWASAPTEYFLGKNGAAPPGYYPIYFLATTPALLFIPLALGIYYTLRSRDPFKLAMILLFVVPFGYDLYSFKQDGIRYLLMIYPGVAMLCAQGITSVSQLFPGKLKDITFAVAGTLTVLYLVVTLALISPYYLDYYNELVGGPASVDAHRSFEIGWWGEGIYEAALYIEHNAPPGSTVYVAAWPPHLIFYDNLSQNYLLPDSVDMNVYYDVDYILTNAYTDRYLRLTFDPDKYKLVYTVKAGGATLARVYKRVA